MATQVLRFETRDEIPGGLVSHLTGKSRPANAIPQKHLPGNRNAVSVIESNLRTAREVAATRSKRCKPAVDVVIAGPPPFASDDAWSDEKVEQWARYSLAWFHAMAPKAVVAVAAVHWDESSPHMHLLVVPRTRTDEVHWSKLQAEMAGVAYKRGRDQRADMSAIQTSYHQAVGQRFGLERGEIGSKKKHQAIDRMAGLDGQIKQVVRSAKQEHKAELAERKSRVKSREAKVAERERAVSVREKDLYKRERALDKTAAQVTEWINWLKKKALEMDLSQFGMFAKRKLQRFYDFIRPGLILEYSDKGFYESRQVWKSPPRDPVGMQRAMRSVKRDLEIEAEREAEKIRVHNRIFGSTTPLERTRTRSRSDKRRDRATYQSRRKTRSVDYESDLDRSDDGLGL